MGQDENEKTSQTSKPNVFVGGDIAHGLKSLLMVALALPQAESAYLTEPNRLKQY